MLRTPGSRGSWPALVPNQADKVNVRALDKVKFAVISFPSRERNDGLGRCRGVHDFGTLTHSETQTEEPKA